MRKATMLTIRIDEADKARIESAANRTGESLSAFVLRAAQREAARVSSASGENPRRGVHSTFRALCKTAEAGGGHGYERVGSWLALNVYRLQPENVGVNDWRAGLLELGAIVRRESADSVAAWFDERLPHYTRYIPTRRRAAFARGVLEQTRPAWKDGWSIVAAPRGGGGNMFWAVSSDKTTKGR